MRLLGECFEALGGVPKTVLADRMGCLKAGVVANVVVPTADYVAPLWHRLGSETLAWHGLNSSTGRMAT
jgi:hypothetical protein